MQLSWKKAKPTFRKKNMSQLPNSIYRYSKVQNQTHINFAHGAKYVYVHKGTPTANMGWEKMEAAKVSFT